MILFKTMLKEPSCHMVPQEKQLQPGRQVKDEPEPGASHGKYKLPEGLFPVTGPQIQIVHVKPLQLHASVYKEAKAQEQGKDLQVILLFSNSSAILMKYFHVIPLTAVLPAIFCHKIRQFFFCLFQAGSAVKRPRPFPFS